MMLDLLFVLSPETLRSEGPFMSLLRLLVPMLLGGMLSGAWVAEAAPTRPNILLILADDMGFSDIGCYGSEIPTPHLDRLAARGLRFTQFYNAARCCPTRAALLTGLYPHQAGVGHMEPDFRLPGYRGFLNGTCVTLAEALGPAGYQTFIVGKWHVGTQRGCWPLARGFERFYGVPQGPGHYFHPLPGRPLVLDDHQIEPPADWFSTEAFTDYAIQFIQAAAQRDKPFFCYLAYYAPHYPLQARPADIQRNLGKYAEGWAPLRAARYARQVQQGIVRPEWRLSDPHPQVPPWNDVEDRQEMDRRMAVYAAQVAKLDAGIGKVVGALEELKILDNTLLVFLSDNGGDAAGGPLGFAGHGRGDPKAVIGTAESYASYGLAWANVSNTPFRAFKAEVFEGGIATPLIVHWPARIRSGGGLRHQVGHVIDIMPTLLDAAGAKYPQTRNGKPTTPPEGMSLLGAIDDRPAQERTLCWEHMGNRAARSGRWKLVAYHRGPWELYDMETDRTETRDLAAQHPERVQELAALYDQWAERCNVRPWSELPLRARGTPGNGLPSTAKPK